MAASPAASISAYRDAQASAPRSVSVGLLMLTETVFAPIWVWLVINEIPPLSVFIGGSIIILALVLKSFDKTKIKT